MAKFLQPYQEALKERMTPFTPEERAALLLALDDEDFENDPMPDEVLPKPPQRYQVASLSSTEDGLVGTSMAGAEMFRIAIGQRPEQLTAQTLLELAADALCVPICCLTLWQGGKEVSGLLEDVSSLTLREVVQDDVRPLICRRPAEEGRSDAMLGEGMVELELDCLPQDGAIQAIAEARRFVTSEEACWLIYTRKEVVSYRFKSGVVLEAEGYFPLPPVWRLPKTAKQWGNSDCDVWSASVAIPVRSLLDEHAQQTNDKPIPRYQMIVDPNQFVHDSDAEGGPVWVPMEVDITSSDGPRAHLVGGDLSHAEPRLAQEVALPVLQAALPLLAKLRRPQLLLEDRRLQVVFKAQRISLPGRRTDGSDSEYVGLWHVDGYRERVCAVVLYYYHVDDALKGGDMEFCGREPIDILGIGDCSNNFAEFTRDSLRHALRSEPRKVANCRVPIGQGTLLVFSNYQMAHRVLRMVNESSQEASRDFVALFVLDPAYPPLRPARQVLARGYLTTRALQSRLSASTVQNIQEFAGERPSLMDRRLRRNELLKEQLRPSGEFCGGAQVVTAGNGCYTMIGWLHHLLSRDDFALEQMEECAPDWKGHKFLKALNLPPKKEHRGMSEMLSLETSEAERRIAEWEEQAETFQKEEEP